MTSDSSWSDNNNSGDIIFCLIELLCSLCLLVVLFLLQLLSFIFIIEWLAQGMILEVDVGGLFDIRWCTILIAIDLSCSLILSHTLEFLDISLCAPEIYRVYIMQVIVKARL